MGNLWEIYGKEVRKMSDRTPHLTMDEKLETILKPLWGYLDVMGYFGVGQRIALDVIHQLRAEGKQSKVMQNRVSSEDVCRMFATTRVEEIKCLNEAIYGKDRLAKEPILQCNQV